MRQGKRHVAQERDARTRGRIGHVVESHKRGCVRACRTPYAHTARHVASMRGCRRKLHMWRQTSGERERLFSAREE